MTNPCIVAREIHNFPLDYFHDGAASHDSPAPCMYATVGASVPDGGANSVLFQASRCHTHVCVKARKDGQRGGRARLTRGGSADGGECKLETLGQKELRGGVAEEGWLWRRAVGGWGHLRDGVDFSLHPLSVSLSRSPKGVAKELHLCKRPVVFLRVGVPRYFAHVSRACCVHVCIDCRPSQNLRPSFSIHLPSPRYL